MMYSSARRADAIDQQISLRAFQSLAENATA
jgi:hypothetical protein